jgi:hypothetical protein
MAAAMPAAARIFRKNRLLASIAYHLPVSSRCSNRYTVWSSILVFIFMG